MHLLERDLTRRLIYAVLLAGATALMVIAVSNGRTSPTAMADSSEAIVALVPTEGADVLRQSSVGIQVATGYRAGLIVNGITIPEDQLSGDPGLGQFYFTPGAGQVIESLQGSQNCVVATFYPAAAGPAESQSVRWCFSAA